MNDKALNWFVFEQAAGVDGPNRKTRLDASLWANHGENRWETYE